jgi:hypothetical protein
MNIPFVTIIPEDPMLIYDISQLALYKLIIRGFCGTYGTETGSLRF